MFKRKSIITGIFLILLSIWFYNAISTFEIEKDSDPKRIIIKEGTVRTETFVAKELSTDMGFDLEGAYKTGHRPSDVIDYLINEPHNYSVTLYNGRYYEGRTTLLYSIPFFTSVFILIAGILIILSGNKKD